MISFSLLNFVSAISIGLIIAAMALVSNVKLKATLYTIPIPITIALIATHGKVTSDNIIGLLLVCGFIWIAYYLHSKKEMSIIWADIIGAGLYIAVGYIGIKLINLSFLLSTIIFCFIWAVVMFYLSNHSHTTKPPTPSNTSPLVKGIGVSIISFMMFTLKGYLSGIVVTFPYSGVFAVIETKNHLDTLSRVLSRNSLAILGLFVTIYVLPLNMLLATKLVLSWVVFLGLLQIVQKIEV